VCPRYTAATIPSLNVLFDFHFSAEKSVRNGLLSDVHQQGRADSSTRGQPARRFEPGPVHTGQRAVQHRVGQRQPRVSQSDIVHKILINNRCQSAVLDGALTFVCNALSGFVNVLPKRRLETDKNLIS